jgi:hypothetical protein
MGSGHGAPPSRGSTSGSSYQGVPPGATYQ